jgi:hypothetical protein
MPSRSVSNHLYEMLEVEDVEQRQRRLRTMQPALLIVSMGVRTLKGLPLTWNFGLLYTY